MHRLPEADRVELCNNLHEGGTNPFPRHDSMSGEDNLSIGIYDDDQAQVVAISFTATVSSIS